MCIHTPPLVGRLRRGRDEARRADPLLVRLKPQGKPVEPIQPLHAIDPLQVDRPAFPPQQGVHPPIAIAHAHRGDLADTPTLRRLILGAAALAIPRPVHPNDLARPSLAHPKADLQQLDTLAHQGRLHRLFRSTSCTPGSMCLSRVRSATGCLS
jgi:hypothetical protein